MEFIFFTILFILGNASIAFLLHVSIQKGEWLDMIFDWQNKLREWDLKGKADLWAYTRFKILGGCELCFSHFVSFLCFWVYVVFIHALDLEFSRWWVWFIWYFFYVPFATNLSLYTITKIWK